MVTVAAIVGLLGLGWLRAPDLTSALLVEGFQLGFLAFSLWRMALILASLPSTPETPAPEVWPRYTVLVALHDEAEVAAQLIARLARIDYPADRLEAFLLLEAHDRATIEAVDRADRPEWMSVLVVPPGRPGTKPRALNYGLAHATGELATIYDAEDHPDPGQLREAASRFMAKGAGRLACLQAPLRIRRRGAPRFASPFLDRQFTVEYAALFEVTLPGMARMGLPFPLGGTSNHFRVDVLRQVGGWDAFNVTEDADLGFRLWRRGWRLGVLATPTWETPPGGLDSWLPQRTRWLKGYMQTWGVHTRRLDGLGLRGGIALLATLGGGLVAAGIHAVTLAWVLVSVLIATASGLPPSASGLTLSVLGVGTAAAWLQGAIAARKAGGCYSVTDMLSSPAYWSLLSLAFIHAAWRLVREPHAWDKTAHHRDGDETTINASVALDAGRQPA